MKSKWLRARAIVAMFLTMVGGGAHAAIISWDGGGGNFSWQTAANWSGDTLPGTNDTVLISVASNITVASSANVTILNLQCSNNLALSGGSFVVRNGDSVVQGQLSASGFPSLSASGAGTKLTVVGDVSANGASFLVTTGATISLPRLTTYAAGVSCFAIQWSATGSGAVLDLPGLTNLTGNGCANLNLQALNGGNVSLTNLVSVSNGNVAILADGAGSVMNLSVFAEALSATRTVALEARNSGTVAVPLLKRGPTLNITLKPGGTLPVAQMELLGAITVSGLTVDFPALTNFNAGSFDLSSDAVVSAPNLKNYNKGPSCGGAFWTVSGSNSVLELTGLTNILGGTCTTVTIQALTGGTVNLSNVVSIPDGFVSILADGTNSQVNLPALAPSPGASRTIAFEARNAGRVWIPLLTGGSTVAVTIKSGGVLPVAQLTQLAGITVSDMTVDFPTLTDFNAGSANVSGGGGVSIPNLTTYNKGPSCAASSWLVTGANSVLRLPALTNVTGGTCTHLSVQAFSGGNVILTNVITVSEGFAEFLADGSNSLVNLTRLQQFPGPLRAVEFEARNLGTVLVPLVTGGPTIGVELRTGGVLAVAQMTQLASVTVEAMAVDFPLLTSFESGNFSVSGGGVVSIPNLRNVNKGPSCTPSFWVVTGSNSMLRLPALTNLTGGNCNNLAVQALTGGSVVLDNVLTASEGFLSFLADGTNSVVDLRRLQLSPGTLRTVALEARNAGTLIVPNFQGGETVAVTIKSGGALDTALLNQLLSLTVSGTSLNLPGITNLFAGNLIVDQAAVLTLPNLFHHTQPAGCVPSTWSVSGTGSVLNLPGLGRLTGGTCVPLNIQALTGGQVLLASLGNIPSGAVSFLSSGAGSQIDLQSLSNFLHASGSSKLAATNSGGLQLNDQPLFLSGVIVNFAPGTPGFPPTVFAATNLILHGHAWRSYWMENRDTTAASNAWAFVRRVPLPNDFQIIGPLAPANTEYRGWEFMADPFLLDIALGGPTNVNLVLYGATNQTLNVLTAANLVPPVTWLTQYTAIMTNTFRILPPQPITEPRRFFRATLP